MSSRIRDLQASLADTDIDLFVINPGSTLRYLTDHRFESHERLFLLLIPREGDPTAVVPQLENDNWRHAVPDVEAVHLWDDADGPGAAATAAFEPFRSARKVAVESLDCRFLEMQHLKAQLPEAEVVSGDEVVGTLRLYKSAEEADNMRRASRIAEETLEAVVRTVRVGDREKKIAGALAAGLLSRGGEGISFPIIALSGPKSALPHGIPDDREVQSGELLLIDFGTSFNGYHSDITRTFAVGERPDDAVVDVYEAVRDANERGRIAARPGATSHEVHTACQVELESERWSDFARHRTGHGLGLEIHEPPSIMRGDDTVLRPGMTFTVEPGLYKDGFVGVRIEDDLWLTDEGAESLTVFPRELRILGAG